jgi:hypothetical protein
MSTPTVVERVIALEPITRDDFADAPAIVPAGDGTTDPEEEPGAAAPPV